MRPSALVYLATIVVLIPWTISTESTALARPKPQEDKLCHKEQRIDDKGHIFQTCNPSAECPTLYDDDDKEVKGTCQLVTHTRQGAKPTEWDCGCVYEPKGKGTTCKAKKPDPKVDVVECDGKCAESLWDKKKGESGRKQINGNCWGPVAVATKLHGKDAFEIKCVCTYP